MISRPHTPAAESYRMLATNLDFVNLDAEAKTIMITSAHRGEGKSTTVCNIAIAIARRGRRVALVDLDLRRPALPRFFDVDRAPGLTDVALGALNLDEALHSVPLRQPAANGRSNGHAEADFRALGT